MMNLSRSPLTLPFFLLALAGCASGSSEWKPHLDGISHGERTIRVDISGKTTEFKLDHTVDGYETPCGQKILITWGKPINFNANNPQDSNLTLIDLQQLKIRAVAAFDKDIHSVEYIDGQPMAIVWSSLGVLVELNSGKIKYPAAEAELDLPLEACPSFPYKSFRKYTE